ncbi:MAG: bifunctional phosphoserine phosphatase/homoserine phosphotransferase ThrH [Chthoniobacteraceae bacterium]|nr:bifunctional phosphoserine phosphatase/homoserine phosphotransferase ThrH [Chthoniobacteraceae bacterium]
MILLLGGTSETAPFAEALARAGYRVLVSTATGIALATGSHPRIEHRSGRLDVAQMAALLRERRIRAVVDATHPYAQAVRATASAAAAQCGVPYLSYIRPGGAGEGSGVLPAPGHAEAARLAAGTGKPILLTIGSRNVAPYAEAARRAGLPLFARVLDHPESYQSCRDAGIPADRVLAGRGPFSVEENRRVLREHAIGVLVTKDSGNAGGVPEKLEAARREGCTVIVVGRPGQTDADGYSSMAELVAALRSAVPPPPCGVLAMDLESVLVPEIWETVAEAACEPQLALTTRDIPDYGELMRRRIALCRQHGLTLMRLREIVGAMEPLPGAAEFLAWARQRALVVILSDTYHELAGPLLAKLGSPLMLCNALSLDAAGYLAGYTLRDPAGKAGAVAHFQRLGARVAAVGDSFNDVAMLQAADAPFLLRPAGRVLEAGVAFPAVWNFDQLQTSLQPLL